MLSASQRCQWCQSNFVCVIVDLPNVNTELEACDTCEGGHIPELHEYGGPNS